MDKEREGERSHMHTPIALNLTHLHLPATGSKVTHSGGGVANSGAVGSGKGGSGGPNIMSKKKNSKGGKGGGGK